MGLLAVISLPLFDGRHAEGMPGNLFLNSTTINSSTRWQYMRYINRICSFQCLGLLCASHSDLLFNLKL